jgi:hypothetical protein
MKIDRETSEVLEQGKHIARIVASDDWVELKSIIEAKMASLYIDIDENHPNEILGENVKANRKAIHILSSFIAQVEGSAYQFDSNRELLMRLPDLYNRS